jgi:hypothetical protein
MISETEFNPYDEKQYYPAQMVGIRCVMRSKSASIPDEYFILDCDVEAMFDEKDRKIETSQKALDHLIELSGVGIN